MNDTVKYIRTIANSEQIEEDLDKLKKEIGQLDKNPITNKKILKYQNDNGILGTDTGSEGANGRDSNGDAVALPNAPPQVPPASNRPRETNNNSTAGNTQNEAEGNSKSPNSNPGNTNLSGAGSSSSAGGSAAHNQAQGAPEDTDLIKIREALIGVYSAEYVSKAVSDFLRNKYGKDGTFPADEVMDGKSGPKPNYTGNNSNSSRLEGVIGRDIVDDAISVVVNIIQKNFIPDDDDAAAAGQNPWTSFTEPPIALGYVEGYFWQNFSGFGAYYSFYHDGYLAITEASFPNQFSYRVLYSVNEAGDTVTVKGSWTPNPDAPLAGDPPPVTVGVVTRLSCVGITEFCPVEPPRPTKWPRTGVYILNHENGKFKGSDFDPDLPEIYKANDLSSVKIKSTIDDRIFEIIPGINGGTVIMDARRDRPGLYFDNNGYLKDFVPMDQLNFFIPASDKSIIVNP